MKKRPIFIALIILLSSIVIACQRKAESIPETAFSSENDSICQTAQTYLYSDPLHARKILRESMLADSSKDSLDWYRLYNLYVKTFIITSELDSALALSEKTLRYCSLKKERSASDFHLLADIHNSIGNIYATTSTSDSALKYFQKTLEYGLLAKDMKTEITAYNNLADVFTRRGDFAQGTYYYRQALHIADSTDIPREEFINTYTGLGICYMELRDFERFNHYFDLAGQMFEQMDLNRQTSYLINRGNGYYYEGRYREALSLFQQGLELVKPTPEYEYIKNLCLVNMGELYLHLDKPDSAQDCLETAYTYFQSLGNNTLLYHAETLLSDLAIRQNNIAKAKMYLQKQSGYDFIEPNSVNLRKRACNVITRKKEITNKRIDICLKAASWKTRFVTTGSRCVWRK